MDYNEEKGFLPPANKSLIKQNIGLCPIYKSSQVTDLSVRHRGQSTNYHKLLAFISHFVKLINNPQGNFSLGF